MENVLICVPSASSADGPRFGYNPSLLEIVDDQDQLVIVIAVEDFDVDAGIGHAAGELAQLSRLGLIEALNQDVVDGEDLDACGFEGVAGGIAVREQKVRDAAGV